MVTAKVKGTEITVTVISCIYKPVPMFVTQRNTARRMSYYLDELYNFEEK